MTYHDDDDDGASYKPPKLKMKLKSTPSESSEKAFRKEQKRIRKERKRIYRSNGLALTPPRDCDRNRDGGRGSGSRAREESITPPRKKRKEDGTRISPTVEEAKGWDDDCDESAWMPPASTSTSAHKVPDPDDEAGWREKLFDLMEDEEGPNEFVSGRYRSPPPPRKRPVSPLHVPEPQPIPKRYESSYNPGDLNHLDEEEYAEAIRYGIWRRRNKEEFEHLERVKRFKEDEERRKKKERTQRDREEGKRIEEIKKRNSESERIGRRKQVDEYRKKWEDLSNIATTSNIATASRLPTREQDEERKQEGQKHLLRLLDLPWPIYRPMSAAHVFSPALITTDAVRTFLFSLTSTAAETSSSSTPQPQSQPQPQPNSGTNQGVSDTLADRRKVLREAILAYHPDRFIGRYLARVTEKERELVKEAVTRCSQIINEIAGEGK